jgi:hypothetical protein
MSDPVRVRPFLITQKFPGLDINGMLQTLSRYMLLQEVRGEPYTVSSIGGRTVRTKVTGHWSLLSQLPDQCLQAMKANIGLILKVAVKLVEEVAVLHRHGIMHGNIRPETILLLLERDGEPCPALGLVDLAHGTRVTQVTRAKDLQDVARCLAWLVARSHMGRFVADRARGGFDTMEAFELAKGSMCARPFVTSTQTTILKMVKGLGGSRTVPMSSLAGEHLRTKPLLTRQQSLVTRILSKISMSAPSHFNTEFIYALLQIVVPAVLMVQEAGGCSSLVLPSYEEEVADFMLLMGAPLLSSCGARVDSSNMTCEFNHLRHELLARVAEEARVLAEVVRSEPLAVLATICDTPTFLNFAAIFHYYSK